MINSSPSLASDMAQVERLLGAPDSGFAELSGRLTFLRSEADAREFLEGIKRGLASIERGELYTTDEVRTHLEARRRARRTAAE